MFLDFSLKWNNSYVVNQVVMECFYVYSVGTWMKSRKIDYLGVPKYWGSGFNEKGGKRYEGGKLFFSKVLHEN